MRRLAIIAALGSFSFASIAQAAGDPGFRSLHAQPAAPRVGAGVQFSLAVPLGRRGEQAQPRLSLRAGPSVTHEATGQSVRHTRVAPFTELSLRPGHSTTWSLAGRPMAQSWTLAGLRQDEARRAEGDRKGVSTLGGIGIGLGVLAVATGVGLLVLIDKANDNSD